MSEPAFGFLLYHARHAVCAEITVALSGTSVNSSTNTATDGAQAIDNIFVVHHFMTHINGRAKQTVRRYRSRGPRRREPRD